MADYIVTDTQLTGIADAIREKGGTSEPLVFPSGFEDAIGDITTGGADEKTVIFSDYDGSVVASYTADEFASLQALPANPDHTSDGLTAQGWNWSLSDAKTYVAAYGALEVGQSYTTTDGKTRIYIHLDNTEIHPKVGLGLNGSADIDWGDGTAHDTLTGTSVSSYKITNNHVYAATGDYVITITITGEAKILGSSSSDSYSYLIRYSSYSNGRNTTCRSIVRSINIGNGVTEIASAGLADFSCLEMVTIPNTVVALGEYAFYYCYKVKQITAPYGISAIGSYSFYNCYSIKHIAIPNGVTMLGANAFLSCYLLSSVTMPIGVTNIGTSCFSGTGIERLRIPNTVTAAGNGAFIACSNLKSIEFSPSMSEIPSNACKNCFNLRDITIPDGVQYIGDSAFYGCYGIRGITIPDSVRSIGSYAFGDCYTMQSATISNSSKLTEIKSYAFNYCRKLLEINLPNGLTTIGSYAFASCYSIREFRIPNTVTSIGSNALSTTCAMTVVLPSGLVSIPSNLFSSNYCLRSIVIPETVTSIGGYAFNNCKCIQSITIPADVASIGNTAFSSCYGLVEIHFKPSVPPALGGGNVFTGVTDCKIYVPTGTLSDYRSAQYYPTSSTITYIEE